VEGGDLLPLLLSQQMGQKLTIALQWMLALNGNAEHAMPRKFNAAMHVDRYVHV
jgi:hypothetical protein